jgi:hypothetical protein
MLLLPVCWSVYPWISSTLPTPYAELQLLAIWPKHIKYPTIVSSWARYHGPCKVCTHHCLLGL